LVHPDDVILLPYYLMILMEYG